jgi:hypothetical protein
MRLWERLRENIKVSAKENLAKRKSRPCSQLADQRKQLEWSVTGAGWWRELTWNSAELYEQRELT